MNDWLAILSEPLPLPAVLEFVTDPAAGGICSFIGTTRSEHNTAGTELIALYYEAYEEMAREQLNAFATRGREKWPIQKLVILHRIGRVSIAEPSIVIAVSAAHRDTAFQACRFLIDTLKAELAVWKKEIWSDGQQRWVSGVVLAHRAGPQRE